MQLRFATPPRRGAQIALLFRIFPYIARKEQHSEPTITKIVVDDTPALRRC